MDIFLPTFRVVVVLFFFFFGGGGENDLTLYQKNKKGLVPQTTSFFKLMFDETTIFHVIIWNHPIETTI